MSVFGYMRQTINESLNYKFTVEQASERILTVGQYLVKL